MAQLFTQKGLFDIVSLQNKLISAYIWYTLLTTFRHISVTQLIKLVELKVKEQEV
jgi:hypothetical protein